MQRKAADGSGPGVAPPIVHEVLNSPGQSLDAQTRSFFEPRFGHDFSKVRIHTDSQANQSARAVNALAYTSGGSIVFEKGQYAPTTHWGRQLLAHELAHVVQQDQGGPEGHRRLLPPGSRVEREAEEASRQVIGGERSQIHHRMQPSQIGRAAKQGDDAEAGSAPPAKGAPPGGVAPAAGKTNRLRFDILGADTAVADFLAKAAAISRDPDLRVTSLEDMITQLESKAPAGSPACVEHISIFNHGMPGYQAVTGEGDKKVSSGAGAPPGKLPRSGFTLDWLYQPANQSRLAKLRNVFCCGAEMYWLGCGTAGIIAQGGKRTEKEVKEHPDRYGPKFGDRYRDEQDAIAHGASLAGAKFGKIAVQSWADATCTTIRSATDFTIWDVNKPSTVTRVGMGGEFLDIKPSAAGECTCDPTSGRVHGTWDPGKRIEYGDTKWKTDLDSFNKAIKPASGSPVQTEIRNTLLALLGDVASSVAVPAGLPLGPKVEPWVNSQLGLGWEGFTFEHMPFCFPNDAWKWIGVNPEIIQQTPAYTRTQLGHELKHAADMLAAVNNYKKDNGPPPAAPSNACTPGFQPKDDNPFGKYVLGFHKFFQSGLAPGRHQEIYASSATANFQKFTPDEKLLWFAATLTTVPANVAVKDPLPSEPLVNSVFEKPVAYEERLRTQFAQELFKATRLFIYDKTSKGIGKARTLVTHFNAVWKIHPADRGLFIESIKLEEKK